MAFRIIGGIFCQQFEPAPVEIFQQQRAAWCGFRGDRAQGFLHPRFRNVHADAFANVTGLAPGLKTGTAQYLAETLAGEIDRGVDDVGGRVTQSRCHEALFVLLGGAVIDLNDRGVLQQFGEAVDPRIEPGAQDHQLRSPAANGAHHQFVDEARPHEHQPDEAEDIGIAHGFLKIPVGSVADGVVGYQSQLSRADQPGGEPVGIAHADIGLARAERTRRGGQNRGAGG